MHAGHSGARRAVRAVLLAVATLAAGAALAQESPSFRLERVEVAATAGRAAAARFATVISVKPSGLSGGQASVCGSTWLQTAGFGSVFTGGPVPIELTVKRLSVDPLEIGLGWTGTDDAFEVRRSLDASTIRDPGGLLAVVDVCVAGDPQPTEADLIFYLILPGPDTP